MIANENDHICMLSKKTLSTRSTSDVPQLCEQLFTTISHGDMMASEVSQLVWLRMLRHLHSSDFDAQYVLSTFCIMRYFLERRENIELRDTVGPICACMCGYELFKTAGEVYKLSKIHSPTLESTFRWLISQGNDIDQPECQNVLVRTVSPQVSAMVNSKSTSIDGRYASPQEKNAIIQYVNRVIDLVPTSLTDRLNALLPSLWGKIDTESGFQEVLFLCMEIERLSTGRMTYINGCEHPCGSNQPTDLTRKQDAADGSVPGEHEIIRYTRAENVSEHERFIGQSSTVVVPSYDLFDRLPVLPHSHGENLGQEIPQYRRPFSSVNEWRRVRS